MKGERIVAGLRCGEVLAALSDYLEGTLAVPERERLEAHLKGCDVCERFGGQMADLVRALRSVLGAAPSLDAGVARRLRRRLGADA